MVKFFSCLLLILFTSYSALAKTLVFQPKVYLTDKKEVSLADIADTNQLDINDIQALKKIRISDMPAQGKSVMLSSAVISEALRKNTGHAYASTKIPAKIYVYNRIAELTKNNVYEKLMWHWQQLCDGCRVEIKNLMLPQIPKNLVTTNWSVQPQEKLPKGSFSEKLIVHDASGREITYWIRGELKVYQRAPVALRTLFMNKKLNEGDYKWEWRDVTFATDSIPDEKQLEQMQLRQGIAANQIIWSRTIAKEKTVKRGELVQVIADGPDWKVSLQAVTEQDGYVGDTINVKNIQTKKVISAEVVGPGEVIAR